MKKQTEKINNNTDLGEIILDHMLARSRELFLRARVHKVRTTGEAVADVMSFLMRPWVRMRSRGRMGMKLVVIVLFLGMNSVGLSAVGYTTSYFFDKETSNGNSFTAAFLDLILSEDELTSLIGVEALGEIEDAIVVTTTSGSLPVQYIIHTEADDNAFCNGILLEATKNGIPTFNDSLPDFSHPTTTTLGTWEFEFDLLPPATGVSHGDTCTAEFVFSSWRADTVTPEESGFTDEERYSMTFTAKMVVMNEILPHPDPSAPFPNDTEWIELYNNGSSAVDVEGWQISELTDPQGSPTEKFYTIRATTTSSTEIRTLSGSTVIPASGMIVVLMNGSKLNNTGDTVSLYDGSTVLMDQLSYTGAEAPEGKSIARIPDGLGAWIDPVPTPAYPNTENEFLGEAYLDALRASLEIIGNSHGFAQSVLPETEEGAEGSEVSVVLELNASEATTTSSTATSTEVMIDTTDEETEEVQADETEDTTISSAGGEEESSLGENESSVEVEKVIENNSEELSAEETVTEGEEGEVMDENEAPAEPTAEQEQAVELEPVVESEPEAITGPEPEPTSSEPVSEEPEPTTEPTVEQEPAIESEPAPEPETTPDPAPDPAPSSTESE